MNEGEPDRSMTPVTPEVAKLKGGMSGNSTANTISRGSLVTSRFGKIQPRYLIPSTGSCHDLCKYGKKDATEAEGKHPFRRRSLWKDITRDKERNQSETLNLGERSKEMVIKSVPLSPLKFQLSDEPNKKALVRSKVTGSHKKLINMKFETPLPTMKGIVSAEQTLIPASSDNEVNQLRGLKLRGPKGQMTELNTAVNQKNLPEKLEIGKLNDMLPANDDDALGESIINERNNNSLVRKSTASVSPKVIKQKVLSSTKKSIPSTNSKVHKGKACPSASKSIPSAKFGGFKQKASASVRADLSIKYAISLKRKAPAVKRISVLNPSHGLIRQRKHEFQITKTLSMSETRKKRVLKSMPAYMSTRTPSNGVLSMKQRNYKNATVASLSKSQERHGKAERAGADRKGKVLDVLEQKSGNIGLGPIQQESENWKSEFSDPNESISEEDMTEGKLESSIGADKRRHTRNTTVHGFEVFSKPQKLRFRRGKVVDLQLENTGPRRLRFRKGRVLGENSNGSGEVQKRIVTKELTSPVLNDPVLETEKVMLRHQDTQEKKDSQGLFNHVIEETATKLVETRKSKVKALVGAFETVISLQEIKPAQSELAIH